MTNSETTTDHQKNQMNISDILEKPSDSSSQTILFPLKVIEYLFLAAFVCSAIITLILPEEKRAGIAEAVSLAVFLFLFFINKQLFQVSSNAVNKSDIKKKAEIYLMNNSNSSANNPITPAREKALQYCQELIDDYKRSRNQSRILYYTLQLATIVFSGVTPILVLVDKLEAGQAWLKWLPVICPAVASIVASVVTSFPFQENSISANTTVELLEAEQEKFILGVTPAYRCYDSSDESEQQQKAKQAIENFIVQVNNIHLKQLQEVSEVQREKTQPEDSRTPVQ